MRLTANRIAAAGLATFAEVGYQGLSMRLVATRLGVQAGSLYYHVPSKAVLLRLMADRVAQQAYDAGTDALAALPAGAHWTAQVEAQVTTLRDVVRAHPGGAILLAESPRLLSVGALSLMERLLQTLDHAGLAPPASGVAADTLLSHTTGYVLQEQGPPVVPAPLPDLHERFPLTLAQACIHDDDEQFLLSVRLICAGVASAIRPANGG